MVSLYRLLQVLAFVCLFAAVAFDVRSPRLPHGTTVLALRNGAALLIDVLQGPVC